ncbi:MAG: AraC family transcriptional regulator ligand-binding domain-containing protein [Myxococcota bacterium]
MVDPIRGRTLTGTWVRGILLAFEQLGLCAEEVCELADLQYVAVIEPTARTGLHDIDRLWRAALDLSGDPFLGLHAGEHMASRPTHVLKILAANTRTLGDAVNVVLKHQSLVTDHKVAALEDVGRDKKVRLDLGSVNDSLPHRREFFVAMVHTGVADLMGVPLELKQVGFAHASRGGTEDYQRVFDCEVLFGQPDTFMLFSEETWYTPNVVWDPVLHNRLESLAVELHSRHEHPGFMSSVSHAIEEQLSLGKCDLASAAKRLRVSDRTLQRKLHDEGARFRDVLDFTRRAIVTRSRQRKLPDDEIARLSGFGSVRAMRRALQRWDAQGGE